MDKIATLQITTVNKLCRQYRSYIPLALLNDLPYRRSECMKHLTPFLTQQSCKLNLFGSSDWILFQHSAVSETKTSLTQKMLIGWWIFCLFLVCSEIRYECYWFISRIPSQIMLNNSSFKNKSLKWETNHCSPVYGMLTKSGMNHLKW